MRKTGDELFRLAARALAAAGAHEGMAQAAARHLVRAEEQGLPTHGMSRVPFYVAMLKSGRADGAARPRIVNQRPGACLIDNADGLPYESCELAVAQVIERAGTNGVGLASITNSNHVGVLGIHLGAVTGRGMAGLAFTNSPAAIPAWGGKKALFGTNPVAAAFPRKGGEPLVIDLALTTVVRGKIMLAARKGEPIPEGWALDRNGHPTTDAKEAMEHGSLFPIGGSKGAMLALAFELLCSALAGAHFGREADSFFAERGNQPKVGQLFMAIDPGALAGAEAYAARVEALVAAMHEDPEVRLPGARRFAAERRARAEGIEVADDVLAGIVKLAERMSAERFDAVVAFPAMHVGVRIDAGVVAEIAFLPKSVRTVAPGTRLAERAVRQLEQYAADPDAKFDLPLAEIGSPFQRRVWGAIRAIPRGQVLTYGQIAKALRSAPRAVGQACGSNWFPLAIPCHRVVGAGGLGGFAHHGEGFHLEVKRWLLEHERAL